jgi:steroid 5-alpha reductase family enzyme
MSWSWLVSAVLAQGVALSAIMTGAWLVRRATGNSGWIDFSWVIGVGLVGAVSALYPLHGEALGQRQWLVAALVALWSGRLGTHIGVRSARGEDDPRYAALAAEWGADAARRMFLFAQAQAAAAIPLAATIFIAAQRPEPALELQDVLGAALLGAAIVGEGIADAQLRRFGADPGNKGRVCDRGLWRWSRHPNYFFQWLGWLAYPLIAFDATLEYTWAWLTLAAPILMYWLLVEVSGIPPLEAHLLRSRGASFADYRSRTSAFFPLPPSTRS